MKHLFILAFALIVSLGSTAWADADEDKQAIKAAVFDYFHGQGEGSHERLSRAFNTDNATMVGVQRNDSGQENVRSWKDMGEVVTDWSAKPNPNGGDRDGEIISMDVVDDRLAVVLFRSQDRFYDALTIGKVNGTWEILSKVFIAQ